ncbi:MAG: DUF2703 domain-containing protein [Methanolinea sp.]|jgi:hypothetical protein|nr:DUF2703 domain-containing protein [Methanolinea sp.]
MTRALSVVWAHLPGKRPPCAICSDTGLSFLELLTSVRPLLERDDIPVTCKEKLLVSGPSEEDAGFSLNGHSLEELLRESDRSQFLCHSSKCQPYRPTVEITRDDRGVRCIKAPELLFRKAILASMEDAPTRIGREP